MGTNYDPSCSRFYDPGLTKPWSPIKASLVERSLKAARVRFSVVSTVMHLPFQSSHPYVAHRWYWDLQFTPDRICSLMGLFIPFSFSFSNRLLIPFVAVRNSTGMGLNRDTVLEKLTDWLLNHVGRIESHGVEEVRWRVVSASSTFTAAANAMQWSS